MTDSIGMKLVSICKVWPRTGMRKGGGTSEVPRMYPRYLRGTWNVPQVPPQGCPTYFREGHAWNAM